MRRLRVAAVLVPASLLLAACQTDTREVGYDPAEAAARGGWQVSRGGGPGSTPSGGGAAEEEDPPHDDLFDPPPRDASDVVQVPVETFAPIGRFFDNEGYLLADRIEIDCTLEPFMARLIGLAYADENGKYVVREEKREGDVHTVRLWNGVEGPNYQANLLPRVTFGSQDGIGRSDPNSGRLESVNLRPFFEFVATEEIVIRFHMNASRDLPVYFRAVARGSPGSLRPDTVKDCVYVNANRRRKARGPEMSLSLEIRRDAEGRWTSSVEDPGSRR